IAGIYQRVARRPVERPTEQLAVSANIFVRVLLQCIASVGGGVISREHGSPTCIGNVACESLHGVAGSVHGLLPSLPDRSPQQALFHRITEVRQRAAVLHIHQRRDRRFIGKESRRPPHTMLHLQVRDLVGRSAENVRFMQCSPTGTDTSEDVVQRFSRTRSSPCLSRNAEPLTGSTQEHTGSASQKRPSYLPCSAYNSFGT